MKNILFTIFIISLSSCGTYQLNRTKEFSKFENSFSEINGEYYGYSLPTKKQKRPASASELFNLGIESDFFTLTYLDENKVKIEYMTQTEEGFTQKEIFLEGKLKKRYFEIYFSKNQFIIPFLVSNIKIDRIRIGKDENGNLVLMNFVENSGNLAIIGAGYAFEKPYLFKKSSQYLEPRPFLKNQKWGYKNSAGEIIADVQYDLAKTFFSNTAIVKKNGKFGLINTDGNEILPLMYDEIELKFSYEDNPYYAAKSEDKVGIISTLGEISVPLIYDEFQSNWNNEFNTRIKNQNGYASIYGVMVPAIYDESLHFNYQSGFAQATRNGNIYFVDKHGYEYETKIEKKYEVFSIFPTQILVPDLDKKRKIELNEEMLDAEN